MVVQSFNPPVISFFASHFSLLYLLGVVVGGWRSVLLLKSPPDSRTTKFVVQTQDGRAEQEFRRSVVLNRALTTNDQDTLYNATNEESAMNKKK